MNVEQGLEEAQPSAIKMRSFALSNGGLGSVLVLEVIAHKPRSCSLLDMNLCCCPKN